jgi:hypothetical protein
MRVGEKGKDRKTVEGKKIEIGRVQGKVIDNLCT